MTSLHNSLRDRQISSIKQILNLNQTPVETSEGLQDSVLPNGLTAHATPILNTDGEPIWKILVFDNLGRDVISSVLRVDDLRQWGITIHLNINSTRQPIPDVPVIYFIEPTPSNFKLIVSDLSRSLYSSAYVNFLSSIPRPLLEDFVAGVAATGTSENISQVYDQYLNFVVSEPDLFSLAMGKETYWVMNSAKSDEFVDSTIDRAVSGLFSVAVTMGAIPIIRCPKGAAAEQIAARLDRKLRDHVLNSKDNLFSTSNQRPGSAIVTPSRPVLVIVDRNVDLIPMLSHPWTYQGLIHDVLKMHLNRITVEIPADESNPGKGNVKRSYDLNSNDFFWNKNAGVLFPQVAQNIDAELTRYRDEAAEITKKTGASSIEDLSNEASASTQHLKAVMSKLPELKERKAILDMHMNIATALLNGIKERNLDEYVVTEENIVKQARSQILDWIKDDKKGSNPTDKLRLFIIWFLSTEQEVNRADMEAFESALRAVGADTASLGYIRQVREITRMTMLSSAPSSATPQQQSSSTSSDLFRGFASISSRLTDRFKEAGLGANFETLISGVKNFLPANRDLTVTKIVESLMDPQHASSGAIAKTEGYLYYDPRSANARGILPPASQTRNQQSGVVGRGIEASFGQRRQGFSEAIVFTVGGGSMEEYGNLMDWANRTGQGGAPAGQARKRVVYGSTEIVNAEEFLGAELSRLGREE